jgi:hypothetical protein
MAAVWLSIHYESKTSMQDVRLVLAYGQGSRRERAWDGYPQIAVIT